VPQESEARPRPVMVLLGLLSRRWALRVLWELRDEPATFRVLRVRCSHVSSSVLSRRLAELIQAEIVCTSPKGYLLTDGGRRLGELLLPLAEWAREHPAIASVVPDVP